MLLKSVLIGIFIFAGNSLLYSQTVNGQLPYFYQEQLDYLPHFKYCKFNGNENRGVISGSEFTHALEQVLNSCSAELYKLEPCFGLTYRLSGISPIGSRKDSYFIISINELGKVISIEVYNSVLKEQLEQCLNEILDNAIINPGIKDKTPVASVFVFIFK